MFLLLYTFSWELTENCPSLWWICIFNLTFFLTGLWAMGHFCIWATDFPQMWQTVIYCKLLVFSLTGVFMQTEFTTHPPLLEPSHSLISLHTLIGKTGRKNIQRLQWIKTGIRGRKKMKCSRVKTQPMYLGFMWCWNRLVHAVWHTVCGRESEGVFQINVGKRWWEAKINMLRCRGEFLLQVLSKTILKRVEVILINSASWHFSQLFLNV